MQLWVCSYLHQRPARKKREAQGWGKTASSPPWLSTICWWTTAPRQNISRRPIIMHQWCMQAIRSRLFVADNEVNTQGWPLTGDLLYDLKKGCWNRQSHGVTRRVKDRMRGTHFAEEWRVAGSNAGHSIYKYTWSRYIWNLVPLHENCTKHLQPKRCFPTESFPDPCRFQCFGQCIYKLPVCLAVVVFCLLLHTDAIMTNCIQHMCYTGMVPLQHDFFFVVKTNYAFPRSVKK